MGWKLIIQIILAIYDIWKRFDKNEDRQKMMNTKLGLRVQRDEPID
jgi:hypothetical protein